MQCNHHLTTTCWLTQWQVIYCQIQIFEELHRFYRDKVFYLTCLNFFHLQVGFHCATTIPWFCKILDHSLLPLFSNTIIKECKCHIFFTQVPKIFEEFCACNLGDSGVARTCGGLLRVSDIKLTSFTTLHQTIRQNRRSFPKKGQHKFGPVGWGPLYYSNPRGNP